MPRVVRSRIREAEEGSSGARVASFMVEEREEDP
jgi:hypothetical protein